MGNAYAKGVALSFGLLACTVSVHNALDKAKSGNKLICTGTNDKAHTASQVTQANKCATCGEIGYTQIKKGRPVEGGFVVITAEESTQAASDAMLGKRVSALTAHPAEPLEASTVPGEKLYYLTPDPGSDVPYAALVALVTRHPELAFVSLWTPSSRASQFRLVVREGVLAMQERVRQENVRSVPTVTAEAPEAMIAMAEQVLALPGFVIDYDASTYADTYEANIAAIVAAKEVTPGESSTPTASVTALPTAASNAMAALQAMLDAANVTPITKRRKKAS